MVGRVGQAACCHNKLGRATAGHVRAVLVLLSADVLITPPWTFRTMKERGSITTYHSHRVRNQQLLVDCTGKQIQLLHIHLDLSATYSPKVPRMQKYKAVEQPDHLDPSQKDSVTSEHARLSGTDEEFSTSAPTYYQNSDQYASSIPEQREADVPLRRLSSWIRFCVTSAFLMLGVAIIFLSWLWFEHHDTPAWRRLMVSAYAAQAITISGVVIRTALSILGTLTTSMIASIILETRGAPLESIVSISLARYANNGPLTLAAVAPNAIGRRIWTLVTAVLALTLASQFMSTILLYDMGPTTVVDFGKTVANNFAFYTPDHTALKYKSHDYYKQRPSSFASFAEYWEPPINTEDDVDDTGITLRALLPLSSQLERESIRTFRGVARVLDSRVVCLRPQVSNFHVCSDSAGLALCGTISRNSVPSDVWRSQGGLTPGPISTDFICAVHHPDSPMPWSLCKVLKGFGFLPSLHNSSMSPEELFPKARFANDWYGLNMVQNTFSWFIIDISELESVGAYDNQTSWSATEIGVEGAWSTLRVKSSLTERVDNIRATWCAELGAYAFPT